MVCSDFPSVILQYLAEFYTEQFVLYSILVLLVVLRSTQITFKLLHCSRFLEQRSDFLLRRLFLLFALLTLRLNLLQFGGYRLPNA